MNKRITDPTVPYVGRIDRGNFYPGNIIRIRGFTPSSAYCFNIILQCGFETRTQNDVAVQVEVHVLDGYISLNSIQNEIWGKEQRGTLPLKRSKKFEIILTCNFNQYKVTINGQHYCEFPQRIHYDRITYLVITGDVSIFQISYESASRDGMGGSSEAGLGEVLRPSVSVFSREDDGDEFEIVTAAATAPNPEIHPIPFSDSSAPPSYEAALDASKRAPYPPCDPIGMPCAISARGGMDILPYPSGGTPGMIPLPSRKIGLHTPPSDAPVPSNVQSEEYPEGMLLRYVIGGILTITIIISLILKFCLPKK